MKASLNSQNKKCRLPLTASKKGKSGDNNGTKVEHIKGCVNVVIMCKDITPDMEERERVTEVFKKERR